MTRKDFSIIINERGFKVCAEIGVGHGLFSKWLLEHCPDITLYSIDPYSTGLPEFRGGLNEIQGFQRTYGERSKVIVRTSEEASKEIDEIFDFVYIDGDHRYETVLNDIQLWYAKIRSGGIISGHDYFPTQQGVVTAVDKFCKDNNLTMILVDVDGSADAGEEHSSNSWYIEKP